VSIVSTGIRMSFFTVAAVPAVPTPAPAPAPMAAPLVKKKYARREENLTVTTNTVESFFALLKRSN
jgi:hypothetical protein